MHDHINHGPRLPAAALGAEQQPSCVHGGALEASAGWRATHAAVDRPPLAAPRAGDGHAVLCALRPTLRALPDLERGVTRAFHGSARPADFAALLQQFAGLQAALGLGTQLAEAGAGAALSTEAEAGAGAAAAGSGAGSAEAGGPAAGAGGAGARPLAGLQGVRSPLLRELLQAAGDPGVAGEAQRMLDSLDPAAAAANDKLGVLRWVGGWVGG